MSAIALTRIHSRTRELAPGFIVSLIVAAAASFLSEHYGAPVMLFALLLGMALTGAAMQSAKHWVTQGQSVPRAEATRLVSALNWRGLGLTSGGRVVQPARRH